MSSKTWTPRKHIWFKGYVIMPYELIEESYDWEFDSMCDCVPAQKFHESMNLWELKAYKTYAYREGTRYGVCACRELGAEANNLTTETKDKLLKTLSDSTIPFRDVKDMFRTAELEDEAVRLMP